MAFRTHCGIKLSLMLWHRKSDANAKVAEQALSFCPGTGIKAPTEFGCLETAFARLGRQIVSAIGPFVKVFRSVGITKTTGKVH